jgi:hypothetical protein
VGEELNLAANSVNPKERAPLTDPSHWNSPARLWGMPYTNWKKRSGYEMRGTLAECVIRWLSLPGDQQRACQMACSEAGNEVWSAERIAAYVVTHGLPPALVAAGGGVQAPAEILARMTAMPRYEPPRPILRSGGHSTSLTSMQDQE